MADLSAPGRCQECGAPALDRHLAYSPREAAVLVGVSREELRREIIAGRLEAKRHGRRYLIPHAALERWLDALPDA